MIRILGTTFAGLLGLAFGSFLNVCLTRWPAGESIVKPGSHCRNCSQTLAWWENVPLASWLVLRGRCRTCGTWIGWRYPAVELASGALWAAIVWQTVGRLIHLIPPQVGGDATVSFSALFLLQEFVTVAGAMLLTWLLVGLAALDVEHLWLPDSVTLSGVVAGIAVTLVRRGPLVEIGEFNASLRFLLVNLAFSILIAGGLVLAIRWIYWLVRRREGIGLGDAKLMAMLAAWLGLPGALLSFAIGVILGAIAGIAVLSAPRMPNAESPALAKLPLGTFLCIGGIIATLWGPPILAAYLRWAGLN